MAKFDGKIQRKLTMYKIKFLKRYSELFQEQIAAGIIGEKIVPKCQ